MKKFIFNLTCLFIVGCAAANAQDIRIPQPSSLQKIEQGLGLGTVTVTYSRPNTKGRKIFDGMEPYGVVWRTGANNATVIKLTDTVTMAGNKVMPGEYSLFTIPGKDEWTIILNKNAKQWGAYGYDQAQDLLRFKVKAAKLDQHLETFMFLFTNVTANYGELHIQWDKTDVMIPMQTDADSRVMANINEAMKQEKKPYYFASIYYYNNNKDMNTAFEWIREAEKKQPQAYNIKYWKARIQLKMGDKTGAIASANEGLALAKAEPSVEYIRLNKEVIEQAGK